MIKEAGKKFRRYIRKHEIQPRLSSFVKKVARRLDELIIGVKCAIYISVHGSLEQEISAYQKYSSDTSLLSVQEIDDVITFRGRSKQVKTDNRVVCFH